MYLDKYVHQKASSELTTQILRENFCIPTVAQMRFSAEKQKKFVAEDAAAVPHPSSRAD